MQKEIKLGIVVGFALLLAILLVWYKSGEETGKPATPGSDEIAKLLTEDKPATPKAEPAPQPEVQVPLPPQTAAPEAQPQHEVKPAPGVETVEIPRTLPAKGEIGPSPAPPPKPFTQVAKAHEHPAVAPAESHEESAREEPKKEEPAKEVAEAKKTEVTPGAKPEAAKKEKTEPPTTEQTYTIQSGDNLHKIARKFYGDDKKLSLIVEANKLSNPDDIQVGQKLKIPPLPAAKEKAKPAETAKKPPAKPEAATAKEKEKPTAKAEGGKKYTVKAGDSLSSIADDEYGDGGESMVDKILAANKNIKDKNKLYVGQVLIIPPK